MKRQSQKRQTLLIVWLDPNVNEMIIAQHRIGVISVQIICVRRVKTQGRILYVAHVIPKRAFSSTQLLMHVSVLLGKHILLILSAKYP